MKLKLIKFIMRNKNLSIESQGVPSSTRYRRTRYKTSVADTTTAYRTMNVESRHINTEASQPSYMVKKRYQSSVCAKKTKTEMSTDVVNSIKSEPRRQSYIEGFNAMLESKISESRPRKQFGQLRVCLPSLSQNNDSEFTLLDPVNLPIEFIHRNIDQVSAELPKVAQEAKQIKKQLTNIKERLESDLANTEAYTQKYLGRLKNMLISDKVSAQQHILKARRMIKQATADCNKLKRQIQHTKTPVSNLQDQFFKGRPFDLQMDPDLESEAPSSYF